MKYFFGLVIASFLLFSMPSCKDGMNWDSVKHKMEDSLITILPTWQSLTLKPESDGTKLLIVVGDATLYKATPDQKAKKAAEVGKMILRVVGENNYLESGSFIVTANVRNDVENPADGIVTPIDFVAIKKETGLK